MYGVSLLVFNNEFKYQDSFYNGNHGLRMLCLNIGEIAIMTVKGADYCFIVLNISNFHVINLL